MLIEFSVQNCFSFWERATFSMIPGLGRLKKEHINAVCNNLKVSHKII